MTYSTLQTITKAYLIGDNKLPPESEAFIALAEGALIEVATKADSMHLTLPVLHAAGSNILRKGHGGYVIRFPLVPKYTYVIGTDASEDVDIDQELCYAVARLIARDVSKDKGGLHIKVADRIIKDYNAKVYEILDSSVEDLDLETCTV